VWNFDLEYCLCNLKGISLFLNFVLCFRTSDRLCSACLSVELMRLSKVLKCVCAPADVNTKWKCGKKFALIADS